MGKPGIIAALAGRFALDTKMHVQHTLNVPLLTLPNNCDEHKIRFKLCRGIEVVEEISRRQVVRDKHFVGHRLFLLQLDHFVHHLGFKHVWDVHRARNTNTATSRTGTRKTEDKEKDREH